MARHGRVEYPGAIYHVTSRMLGDARSRLFKVDADYERYLLRLSERVEQYNIRLYMFTCMRNHTHLVCETPEGNLSKFMQSLSTAYTVYYNLRHKRHRHLFDGRFKAKLVDSDNYLLALSRYVHLNPIKVAGVKSKTTEEKVEILRKYRWSSYPGYIDEKRRLEFVEYSPFSALMGGDSKRWPGLYQRYVEEGLDCSDREFLETYQISPRCIGGSDFVSRVEKLYCEISDKYTSPEDMTFRRVVEPLKFETVFSVIEDVL
jgi:REP element-mobilizing transposase RayT